MYSVSTSRDSNKSVELTDHSENSFGELSHADPTETPSGTAGRLYHLRQMTNYAYGKSDCMTIVKFLQA